MNQAYRNATARGTSHDKDLEMTKYPAVSTYPAGKSQHPLYSLALLCARTLQVELNVELQSENPGHEIAIRL